MAILAAAGYWNYIGASLARNVLIRVLEHIFNLGAQKPLKGLKKREKSKIQGECFSYFVASAILSFSRTQLHRGTISGPRLFSLNWSCLLAWVLARLPSATHARSLQPMALASVPFGVLFAFEIDFEFTGD